MKALQSNYRSTIFAFYNDSICVPSLKEEIEIPNCIATFDLDDLSEIDKLKDNIISDLTCLRIFLDFGPRFLLLMRAFIVQNLIKY